MDIAALLDLAVRHQASDLHLCPGLPPLLRVHGELRRQGAEALSHAQVSALLTGLMDEAQRRTYAEALECDFAVEAQGLRLRVNAFHQRLGAAAVLRLIPQRIPTLQELQAPPVLAELALRPRGLVLVTGPTGSGKSTTLAALLNHRNEHTQGHLLTVEDPIEFVHDSLGCLVTQRELGTHTRSFAAALRAALREDPDLILVGELRDLDTIRLALTAAETGHLVLATLHSAGAAQAVDRLVDVFPAGEKEFIRALLAESLQAVVAQTLCRRRDGPGRTAAYELMLGTPAIRHLIREHKVAQMASVLQTGQQQGMQTLDQHLSALVRRGVIDPAEARAHAQQPESFTA
ncbi:type IV pilus twitching motility protein PilT [Azohydromonas caseinilytica]|uniref:Type IV pilus twitching motility protein PilT n=1 Tax=Azohydromonas caseinilytica TaxID=2728836 RepID=A0A848F3C8_9BURK|nr:type IV pilus twitching motility protein PilT [Azohydromonas caseinilytica]NML13902.1 type IV pilus twitching motility protein PilT [Azohydromonas caseinilytica]